MGAINLLVDMTSESPVLPVRSAVTICGGGEIQKNRHTTALYEYDATYEAMRAIVEALFFDPAIPPTRRTCNGAMTPASRPVHGNHWRQRVFRRPGLDAPSTPSSKRAYERIDVPVLVVEGAGDKLLPPGWAAEIAEQITNGRSAVIQNAGHCPQIEQPDATAELLLAFFAEQTQNRTDTA